MAISLLSEPNPSTELSTFFGRRRELVHLRTLLATDRLVTLTGTGGVGKTRLAMELAHGAGFEFPAGVWVVELARIGSSELVGTAIAEATSAARESQASALERAGRRLNDGRQLLILDNCEHVVAGAAEASWYLLTHCPGLTILATSREALDVRGERVVPLLPLQVAGSTDSQGDPDTTSEAMRLFSDRAQLLDADGELRPDTAADVAEICRRLDGIPLALELAAAWVPVLSLKQVRDRLDGSLLLLARSEKGRPTRHRSIHAALDWSQRLLTPQQAAAFARLSVFVGGFSLEGADAVLSSSSDEDGGSALELVAALVARSLLIADTSADEARYRLLEPVRQYAAEHLRADPDDAEVAARRRHLSHFAALAEAAEEPIIGGPDQPSIRRLDTEMGNIRAALAWGFANDHATASRLAAALLMYCWHRGLYSEGAAWARQAALSTGPLRARALCMGGWLSSEMGDAGRGRVLLDEAYRITAESGGLRDLAMVLTARALAEYVVGDLDALRATAEEAVAVARRSGSRARLMWALWAPAVSAAANDDHQRALDLFREAHAIAVDLGNVAWGSVLAVNVVECAIDYGDTATASTLLRRELHAGTAGDPSCAGYLIENAAILAIQQGDHAAGIRLLGASRADLTRTGYRETPDEATRRRHWIDAARQQLDAGAADALWDEGEGLTLAEALDAAREVVAQPAAAMTAGAVVGNSFIREGEFWSLAYAGTVTRVKDSKGVRDLATLIAASGRSVAAVDLVGGGHGRSEASSARGHRTESAAGEVLDAEARAQYRVRLVELDEAISDADGCNDPHRASRARDERAFLLAELGAAVGLSGRPRLALDPAERARKAVAWRVREAIHHIEAAHPALGRHLRHAVRTGSFCVYDPDQPTEWRL